MIITFAGHSFISSKDKIKKIVKEQMRNNIKDSTSVTCYLGGYGDFDALCANVCRELKQEFTFIEIVYVTPYISLSEQTKIKEMQKYGLYDASIYPPIESTPPKFAILKRNEWMIEKADIVITYVDRNFGGAFKSLQTAKRRKKKVINIFDLL